MNKKQKQTHKYRGVPEGLMDARGDEGGGQAKWVKGSGRYRLPFME